MCNSKKHSGTEHKDRLTLGRMKSEKWWACLSNKEKSNTMKQWWEEHREEMTQIRRDQVTPDVLAKLSKRMKKQWADPEFYAKMCKIRKTQSKGNMIRHPEGSWYRTKYKGIKGSFWMRSGWEVAFALWLDHYRISWEYESKRFALGKGKHYTPDFYLPNQDEYVELKGWMTKKDEKKIKLFRTLYPDIKLYMFFGNNLAKVLEFRKAA